MTSICFHSFYVILNALFSASWKRHHPTLMQSEHKAQNQDSWASVCSQLQMCCCPTVSQQALTRLGHSVREKGGRQLVERDSGQKLLRLLLWTFPVVLKFCFSVAVIQSDGSCCFFSFVKAKIFSSTVVLLPIQERFE